MTIKEFGDIFNAFMEHITWTNYGGPVITILGRDIGIFIMGYITHLILDAFIEVIKEERKRGKKR